MSCGASLQKKPTSRKETHSAKVCSLSLKKIFNQSINQSTNQPANQKNKPTIRCIQNMHASRLHIPNKIELIIAIPFANHARQTYNIIQKATVQQKSRHFDPANQVDQNNKMEHFIFSHTSFEKKSLGRKPPNTWTFSVPFLAVPGLERQFSCIVVKFELHISYHSCT